MMPAEKCSACNGEALQGMRYCAPCARARACGAQEKPRPASPPGYSIRQVYRGGDSVDVGPYATEEEARTDAKRRMHGCASIVRVAICHGKETVGMVDRFTIARKRVAHAILSGHLNPEMLSRELLKSPAVFGGEDGEVIIRLGFRVAFRRDGTISTTVGD